MSYLIIMINSYMIQTLRGCLVHPLKHIFSIFKQHYTYFYTLFHPQVFPHMFSNTCYQFLSTCTKHLLDLTYNITKKYIKRISYCSKVFVKKTYCTIFLKIIGIKTYLTIQSHILCLLHISLVPLISWTTI